MIRDSINVFSLIRFVIVFLITEFKFKLRLNFFEMIRVLITQKLWPMQKFFYLSFGTFKCVVSPKVHILKSKLIFIIFKVMARAVKKKIDPIFRILRSCESHIYSDDHIFWSLFNVTIACLTTNPFFSMILVQIQYI